MNTTDSDTTFKGHIQTIQWNNRIKSNLLFLWFFVSVAVFTFSYLTPIGLIAFALDGDTAQALTPRFYFQSFKIGFKIFVGTAFVFLYFVYRDIKNAHTYLGAEPVTIAHNHIFYRTLETLCVSRRLTIPKLFVLTRLPPHIVTGVVLQNPTGRAFLMVSPAVTKLDLPEMEAFVAIAVQRLYTRDALFFTMLSFFGYYSFHLLQSMDSIRRFILSPFFRLAEIVMAPVRNAILNIRNAAGDATALTLTKEKEGLQSLMRKLATTQDIETYYHEPCLPLFLVQTNISYRRRSLAKA